MNTKKYKFQKLTPIRDVKLGVYADALDYVFSDDDLENIAITGPYSSGKSSMLETYKVANEDKKFIHISLAHFEADTNHPIELDDTDKSDEKVDEKKFYYQQFEADIKSVEGKILNQLIHQIDTKEIPQTHFKIKRRFYPEKTFAISAILTVFFVLLIFLFNRNTWIVFANGITQNWLGKLLKPTITEWFAVACIVVSGFLFLWGLYSILEIQHNKNLFRKLSFRGNEIEIFEKDDGSFFDKHLNEVIYLFKNTEADAIVFEDMDRYNANQIFEKLREINYLLNNSINNTLVEKSKLSRLATRIKCKILKKEEEETCDKVFKFFYLLRDDIFTSKDRTKFFDFIIPIVPVISGSNSYDKFIEYFKEGGMLGRFKVFSA